jgi:putative ABC transport system permease protein
MRSILLFVLANIRNRKLQNLLIGMVLFLASIMLAVSLGVLGGIQNPFEKMYRELKTSHFLLFIDHDLYHPTELKDWWQEQPETASCQVYSHIKIYNFFFGNKEIKTVAYVTERPPYQMEQDQLSFIASIYTHNPPLYPDAGECWLPLFTCQTRGIELNDRISLPTGKGRQELKVAGIVVDPQFFSSMGEGVRIWTAPGSLNNLFPAAELNQSLLSVRLADPAKIDLVWQRFTDSLGGVFSGYEWNYNFDKFVNTIFYTHAGIELFIISIIVFLIAIYLIMINISNLILADYRVIGILKAQGFTPGQFPVVYMLQFFMVSLVFIIVGIITAGFINNLLLTAVYRNMGFTPVSQNNILPGLISFFILIMVVCLSSFITAVKAAGIKSSQAIRFGTLVKKFKNKYALRLDKHSSWNIPVFLGIRNLFNNRGRLVNTIICFCLSILITALSLNILQTLNLTTQDMRIWGLPDIDLTVIRSEASMKSMAKQRFLEILSETKGIKDIIEYNGFINLGIDNPETGGRDIVWGEVFSENIDITGLGNIEGRNPWGLDEISISLGLARKYKKVPGDNIELSMESINREYKIVGIYQAWNKNNLNIRMGMQTYRLLKPAFETREYLINLNDGLKAEDYISRLQSSLGMNINTSLETRYHEVFRQGFFSVFGNMIALFSIIGFVFLLIAFFVVTNTVVMQCMEERQSFGLLKAIGMTPVQLRLSFVLRTAIVMIFCLVLTLPLGIILTPLLMGWALSPTGVVYFPVEIHLAANLLLIPFFLLIATVSAWVSSAPVTSIKAQELITE